jgi:hypothetical protein
MAARGNLKPVDKMSWTTAGVSSTAVLDTIVCGRIINGKPGGSQWHLSFGWDWRSARDKMPRAKA